MGDPLRAAEDRLDLSRGLDGTHSAALRRPQNGRLGAQNLAALGTTAGEDGSAATGGHTHTEAVRLRALPNVRLVCTLHLSSSSVLPGLGQSPTIICGSRSRCQTPVQLDSRCNASRTNYALRESVLAARRATPGGTTAVSCCGANPGMVSWFVKQALVNLAGDLGERGPEPKTRAEWAAFNDERDCCIEPVLELTEALESELASMRVKMM